MIWENGIETCILSCKKRIASLGLMQDAGCLGLVHWDDPERWYGKGSGKGAQDWELMYTRGRFMLMYGKTNTVLQSKIKLKKKRYSASLIIREMQIKTTMSYQSSHQSEWPSSKSLQTINAGKGVEKMEHSCTAGGNVN